MADHGSDPVIFFDLYARGDVSALEIDDYVEAWHNTGDEEQRSLSEYLGLTEDDYAVWLMDVRTLPIILSARRSRVPLPTLVAASLADLRAADNPMDKTPIWSLSQWMARHVAA